MHLHFRELKHDDCLSDGLVTLGTFSFDAHFKFLLSLLCDRCSGEGELGRSLSSSLLMSCIKLHDSSLEQVPFVNHCLQSWNFLSSLLLLSCDIRLMVDVVPVLSFRGREIDSSSPDQRIFQSYSSSVYSLLIHSSVRYLDYTWQMCLQLFRISVFFLCTYFSACQSLGVSFVDKGTSFHFVSNPWTSSRLRVTLVKVTEFQNSFVDISNTNIHIDHISDLSFVSSRIDYDPDSSFHKQSISPCRWGNLSILCSSFSTYGSPRTSIFLRNIGVSFDRDFLFDFG